MKNLFFILAIVFFNFQVSFTQEYIPTAADIRQFPQTKTMMVLEESPLSEYNFSLKDAVPDEWNITPFDFMEWRNFEAQKRDRALSFLLINNATVENDRSNTRYLFMSLLLGGTNRSLANMPDLCSIPLAYDGADEETYIYKIGVFLHFIQNHVKLLTADPSIATKNVFQYYNRNIQKLEDKTLYLIAEELAGEANTVEKIRQVYDGQFKLVTKEDIQKAIADKDPNVVFLHKVGPGRNLANARCFKILVGAADAQFYYFDYHTINNRTPDGFLASDFRKLSRQNR